MKLSKNHPKNDILKTSKSQRYSDYSGFVKSRVGEMMPTPVGGTAHFSPFWQKMRNSRAILAPLEIRRGTLNLTFSVRWSFKVVKFLIQIMQSNAQGRFHRRFYGFWAVSKNRCFFDRVKGLPKITKIEPWSEKGSPR